MEKKQRGEEGGYILKQPGNRKVHAAWLEEHHCLTESCGGTGPLTLYLPFFFLFFFYLLWFSGSVCDTMQNSVWANSNTFFFPVALQTWILISVAALHGCVALCSLLALLGGAWGKQMAAAIDRAVSLCTGWCVLCCRMAALWRTELLIWCVDVEAVFAYIFPAQRYLPAQSWLSTHFM